MKPTYGRVSRYGLIAYGSSLDQVGPLTKNVEDCAAVLEAIAAHDPRDSTSVRREDNRFTDALGEDTAGLRIGIPRDYIPENGGEGPAAGGGDAGGQGSRSGRV